MPILGGHVSGNDTVLATVPELVLDTDMYDPSRIMRSVQYIFDQDVIRIWNDVVIGEQTAGAIGNSMAALSC